MRYQRTTLALAVTSAALVLGSPPASAAGNPADVQSPVSGTVTSAPGEHHRVFWDPIAQAYGDVAMDVGAPPGTSVHPRVGYGGSLTMTVSDVFPACSAPADGGTAVRVDITTDGTTVGSVTYAHLANVGVSPGQSVGTDTELGVVAGSLPYNQACWTGPHVHVEWVNHRDWGCYVPRSVGSPVSEAEMVGRVGGDFGEGPNAVCP